MPSLMVRFKFLGKKNCEIKLINNFHMVGTRLLSRRATCVSTVENITLADGGTKIQFLDNSVNTHDSKFQGIFAVCVPTLEYYEFSVRRSR